MLLLFQSLYTNIKNFYTKQKHSHKQKKLFRRPDCNVEAKRDYRICACDPQCARYGDCCRSSPYFVPEEQRLGASLFTCTTPSVEYIYVMTKCPPEWKDSDTRNRCEHPDSIYRDPLLDAPLTSLSTNTTYKNWHCAFCHGDLGAATTVIWNVSVTCVGSERPTPLSDEKIAERLSFNPITSQWNLNISPSTSDIESNKSTPGFSQGSADNNEEEIHPYCHLKFTDPAMDLPTRWCYSREVGRCSDSWEDAEVKAQCEAYTARVCSGWYVYRNRHCLLCNHIVVPQDCYYSEARPSMSFPWPFFNMLLDWRTLEGEGCAPSEKYDPISHVCRKIFI